jgi:hypothetical protein
VAWAYQPKLWEVEIRRIRGVEDDRKICETPCQWKKAVCGSMCLSALLLWGVKSRQIAIQAGLGERQDPISKITRAKRAGGMDLAVGHIPSKQKGLVHYCHQKIKQK